MIKKNTICVITLGCSKNTVDSERLKNQLGLNGFLMQEIAENSEYVIINTCGFIDTAKEESIEYILNAVKLKEHGKISKIFVIGCLAERYKSDLASDIPEVDKYFGVEAYSKILSELGGRFQADHYLERSLTQNSHFAYLKVSEGCSNACSFCSIPLIRGLYRSKSQEELLKESELLVEQGVKELILIGQDTTNYGLDMYGERRIGDLLEQLNNIKRLEWIRLLYGHPKNFPLEILTLMVENPKICRYIDMPLQHISDKVLTSMNRGINSKDSVALVEKIKNFLPDLTLRTTFIVGYPMETKKEFKELCKFVRDVGFDRLGAFKYSQEEGTSSFKLGDPVPEEEKEERLGLLMELQQSISRAKNRKMLGKKIKVIIDEYQADSNQKIYLARSEKDAPEVDGNVIISSYDKELKIGDFYEVVISDYDEYDLYGDIF